MKKNICYCLITLLGISCNYFQSNHPQADITASQPMDEQVIRKYADSIDASLNNMDKSVSLVFTLRDSSFYITRYSINNTPVFYRCSIENAGDGSGYKNYYLKDNRLILYTEYQKSLQSQKMLKQYFRNDIGFYSESKQDSDSQYFEKKPFSKTPVSGRTYGNDIQKYEDALAQRGRFDLVFDSITEYPKARYLILSRREINAYRAPVLINREDDFIREIIQNPGKYRGEKLDIQWAINDNQAVYIAGALMR